LKEKRPLTGKLSKFCSEKLHCDTDRRVVFKFREIWLTQIGEIVHTVRALESESNIRLKPSFEPNNKNESHSGKSSMFESVYERTVFSQSAINA